MASLERHSMFLNRREKRFFAGEKDDVQPDELEGVF